MRYTNAVLADGRRVDIDVDDGRITALTPTGSGAAGSTGDGTGPDYDLGGWLVLPGLVEPHAHLDKALTADLVPNPTGDLGGAIESWIDAEARGLLTVDGMIERATAALRMLVINGVTAVRTHVNVGASNSTASISAVRAAAAEFAGVIDVEIVALTSAPMTGSAGAGNRAALEAAIVEGVDLIGGCPHLDVDERAMIDTVLALGEESGLGLDLHVDETLEPSVLSLRTLAERVLETGFSRPVQAGHCVSLGVQPVAVQDEVIARVAEAGISVVALPQTNLFLQGRDHPVAPPRGVAPVRRLLDGGVRVVGGGDNVQDPFNLMGRGDPLEIANLLVTASHVAPADALALVAGGRSPIAVGDRADLVAVDAPTVRAAMATMPAGRVVIKSGRVVARRRVESDLFGDGPD